MISSPMNHSTKSLLQLYQSSYDELIHMRPIHDICFNTFLKLNGIKTEKEEEEVYDKQKLVKCKAGGQHSKANCTSGSDGDCVDDDWKSVSRVQQLKLVENLCISVFTTLEGKNLKCCPVLLSDMGDPRIHALISTHDPYAIDQNETEKIQEYPFGGLYYIHLLPRRGIFGGLLDDVIVSDDDNKTDDNNQMVSSAVQDNFLWIPLFPDTDRTGDFGVMHDETADDIHFVGQEMESGFIIMRTRYLKEFLKSRLSEEVTWNPKHAVYKLLRCKNTKRISTIVPLVDLQADDFVIYKHMKIQ